MLPDSWGIFFLKAQTRCSMLDESNSKMLRDMQRALEEADDMHLKEPVVAQVVRIVVKLF